MTTASLPVTPTRPSLVLGDDHVVFTDAITAVLREHGYAIAATARTIDAVLDAVRGSRAQLCLLDRRLADGDGVDALAMVSDVCPTIKVMMLTADGDADSVGAALERGAVGYVHKTRSTNALVDAINRVLAGEIVVDVPTGRRSGRAGDGERDRIAAQLTRRERQCLALLVDGLSTAAMARRLGVSSATVRSHVQSLFTKLDAHSRLEVASLAVRLSLLDPAVQPISGASGGYTN
ncbi:MAG: response regulator transcription factor [Sciscionella sp.]|nr:response regulator transcription factor [Sciscionella sp.]